MKFKLSVLSFLIMAVFANAGEWGSSGGEFIKDRHNPWFLKNTPTVHYCIELDKDGISIDFDQVISITNQVIQFWKNEFKSRGELLGVGIQNFILTNNPKQPNCIGNEDLVVQFGYQTLSKTQLDTFASHQEDPHNYIGVALRTDYDKKNLRAKGFIFISSDQGDHAYNHGIGVVKKLWQHDGLIFRALLHEFGHVFGIPHSSIGFMAADFPEFMLKNYKLFRTIDNTITYFTPVMERKICKLFTYLDMTWKCLIFRTSDSRKNLKIFGISITNEEVLFGTIENLEQIGAQLEFPIKVYLSDEQTIFENLRGEKFWKGPSRQYIKFNGDLTTNSNEKKPILVEISPENIEIYTVVDSKIEKLF